jgi:site-specific recombinase XerC
LKADPNETALFLSERGARLCPGSINYGFDQMLKMADIPKPGYSPHSLRHTSVTHESRRFSVATNQRKHRHEHAATTQHYTHTGDDFVDEEIRRTVSREIQERSDHE